jgi:hypothetical protein
MSGKYKLGQTVYYMDNNRIISGIIGCIDIHIQLRDGFHPEESEHNKETVNYGLLVGAAVPNSAGFREDMLYGTKKDLVDNLMR